MMDKLKLMSRRNALVKVLIKHALEIILKKQKLCHAGTGTHWRKQEVIFFY